MTPTERAALNLEWRNILDRATAEGRDHLTSEDQIRVDAIDKALMDEKTTQAVRDALSAEGQAVAAAATGQLEPGSRDPIRAMIEAHEAEASFAWPETRAIADSSDAGALYEGDFASAVAVYARTVSPWLALGTVRQAADGRPLTVPKLTADPTVYTPGEGTAITESTPTLGSATLTTTSYKSLSYVSAEAMDDAEYDLSAAIVTSAGRAIGLAAGSAFTTAILTAATNGGTATGLGGGGTATFAGYEDLLGLKYGRTAPYRANGAWVMANGMILKARKFTDKQGQYLWQPAVATGQPGTFDGDAVYEDPFLASPGSATKSTLFGDFRAALLIKTTGIRVAISKDFRFDTDQVAVKVTGRMGLVVQDPEAIAYLVSANS